MWMRGLVWCGLFDSPSLRSTIHLFFQFLTCLPCFVRKPLCNCLAAPPSDIAARRWLGCTAHGPTLVRDSQAEESKRGVM
jgi:hypothetical protein